MLREEIEVVERVVLTGGIVEGMERVIVDEVVGRLVRLHLLLSRSVNV